MKPYYDDGRGIVLYHGRAEEVLPTLPKFDLIITSPPYNMGVTTGGGFPVGHYASDAPFGLKRGGMGKWARAGASSGLAHGYGAYDDAMPWPQYEAWQREILTLCWAQLSETGAIFYNHKPRPQAGEVWLPLALNPGLPIRQIITWARAGGINFAPTHYVPMYEWVIVFARPAFRLRDKAASGAGDIWYIPQEIDTPHPAPFPVELPRRILTTTSPQSVCDPFGGWGTTAVACRTFGIPCTLIEVNERYCELTVKRLYSVLDFGPAPERPAQGALL